MREKEKRERGREREREIKEKERRRTPCCLLAACFEGWDRYDRAGKGWNEHSGG